MNYICEGHDISKGKHVYDIALVDALTGEKIAHYTGYYNFKTRRFRLYPKYITKFGKNIKYRMEEKTISASQVTNFE
ncbi:MAG: hypothetical protein ABFC57_18495 [Veillonellales bacterium]